MAEKLTPAQKVKAKQAEIAQARKAQEANLEALQKELDIREQIEGRLIDQTEREKAALELKVSSLEQEQKLLQETLRLQIQAGHQYENTADALKDTNKALEQGKGILDDQNDSQAKLNSLLKEQNALASSAGGLAENFAQQMGFAGTQANTLNRTLSGIEDQITAAARGAGNMQGAMGRMAKAGAGTFSNVFNVGSLVGNFADDTMEMAKELDNSKSSIVGMGYSLEQTGRIIDAADKEFYKLGGSADQLASAINNLDQQGFTKLRQTMGTDFIKTLSQAQKAGLDMSDTGELMNQAMIQQGLSADEAKDRLGDLVAISGAIGEPVGKSAKQFAQFSGRLNQFGPKAVKVFKNLKDISKASGVEMGKLLDVAKGFDTFEGAAESAARMNAVLGTQLDSMALMRMSDDDRIKSIQGAIRSQGGLNNITAQQARLLEEVIPGGLKLNEIMGLTNKVHASAADVTKDNSAQVDGLAKRADKGRTVQKKMADQMKATGRIAGGELAKGLDKAADMYSKLSTEAQLAAKAGLAVAGSLMKVGQGMLAAGAGAAGGGTAAGGGIAAFTKGVSSASVAAPKAALVLGVITLAVLGLAAAFKLASEGVAVMVKSMAGTSLDKLKVFGETAVRIALAFNPVGAILQAIEFIIKQVGETFATISGTMKPITDSITQLVNAAAGLTFTGMAGFGRFATNLSQIVTALNRAESGRIGALTAATSAATAQNINVKVVLDSAEFRNAVLSVVSKKL